MTTLMLAVLGAWFAALFAGPAIYAAIGLAGFAFLALAGIPGIVIPQKVAMAANSFPLLAAPLFILMGNLMNASGISYRIFDFAKAIVGWMRGGLCQANIVGSVIFAGMSGSAVADAAGLGTVEIEAMKREGYDAETAAAITAASATIGPIIPPSLPMIVCDGEDDLHRYRSDKPYHRPMNHIRSGSAALDRLLKIRVACCRACC